MNPPNEQNIPGDMPGYIPGVMYELDLSTVDLSKPPYNKYIKVERSTDNKATLLRDIKKANPHLDESNLENMLTKIADYKALLNKIQFWKKSKVAETYSSLPAGLTLDDILYKDECPRKEINPEVEKYLEGLGYTLLERLDGSEHSSESEGHTSIVYLANFRSGDINKKRVLKIPVNWIDSSSITTIINMSKRNVYRNEIKYSQHFSNELAHENIVDVVDHLRFKDQDIIIENYIANSKSLKSLLKWSVPDDTKLGKIYNKILDAFEHMHKNGVIYRDGKSSNVLVTDDGLVKIIDLQNCVHESDYESSALQTKGGTAYSKPDVINAVMKGKSLHPSKDMDRHSLMVMNYEMITGKLPFNYELKRAKEGFGKEILVDGKKYNVVLLRNGKIVDEITRKMYDEDCRNAVASLKGREKRFASFFEKGFTNDTYEFNPKDKKKPYNSIDEIRTDFNDILNSKFNKLTDILYKSIRPVLVSAAITSAVMGLGIVGKQQANKTPPKPTLSEILRDTEYKNFGLEDVKEPEYSYMWSTLESGIKRLKKKITAMETSGNEYYNTDIPQYSKFSQDVHQIDIRLYSSLCRAIAISDSAKLDNSFMKDRYWPTLVPKEFSLIVDRYDAGMEPKLPQKMAYAAMYMKVNLGYGKNIADVYASYLCSNEEIANAKFNSKSWKFYPYIAENSEIMGGYADYLPFEKRNIIDDAITLYEITDEKGTIHWDRLPKFVFKGLSTGSSTYNTFEAIPPADSLFNESKK